TRDPARTVAKTLTVPIRELASYRRVIISPDAELHHLPFELLTNAAGSELLESHVVSYVPSDRCSRFCATDRLANCRHERRSRLAPRPMPRRFRPVTLRLPVAYTTWTSSN